MKDGFNEASRSGSIFTSGLANGDKIKLTGPDGFSLSIRGTFNHATAERIYTAYKDHGTIPSGAELADVVKRTFLPYAQEFDVNMNGIDVSLGRMLNRNFGEPGSYWPFERAIQFQRPGQGLVQRPVGNGSDSDATYGAFRDTLDGRPLFAPGS